MTQEKPSMLEVENIRVDYGGLHALKGVSLEVNKGEIVAIVGTNGAGKSTLIHAISGLVQPSEGAIRFEGKDITKWKPYKIVDLGISQVPEGRLVFGELTVLDNLITGSYIPRARANKNKNLQKTFELFPRLRERQDRLASTLSGGEQQMLAIGRAIMSEPKLILFDEISLGLAPKVIDEVYEVVRQIRSDGVGVILVEQNTVRAFDEADRAYFLEVGRVALSGNAKELQERPEVQRICFI